VTPAARLRRTATYAAEDLDGDVLLYDGDTLQLLEGVAAYLWARLDGSRTVEELVAAAAQVFAAPAEQVDRDVRAFLFQLEIRGLVEPVEDAGHLVPDTVGWVRDGGEVLLIDLASGRRRTLSPTGASIWEAVADEGTLDAVVARVRDEYPDAPPELREQVGQLLDELVAEGLLRR